MHLLLLQEVKQCVFCFLEGSCVIFIVHDKCRESHVPCGCKSMIVPLDPAKEIRMARYVFNIIQMLVKSRALFIFIEALPKVPAPRPKALS